MTAKIILALLPVFVFGVFSIADKGDFKKLGPRESFGLFMLIYIFGILVGVVLQMAKAGE